MTNAVNLSKNPPSPNDNLKGGQDWIKRCSDFEYLAISTSPINSTDLTYGYDRILKTAWITIPKSTTTKQNKVRTGSGTIRLEVIIKNKAKLSQRVQLNATIAMEGEVKTKLWKFDNNCRVRYIGKSRHRLFVFLCIWRKSAQSYEATYDNTAESVNSGKHYLVWINHKDNQCEIFIRS